MCSKPIVLCLGDSHTYANLGGSWVQSLSNAYSSPSPPSTPLFEFVNAGVNGAQAINVYASLEQRLKAIDRERLAAVTLLIGTNDVLLSLGDSADGTAGPSMTRRYYSYMNGYNGPANVNIYKDTLRSILTSLSERLRHPLPSTSGAQKTVSILVITLPPIGEDLDNRANLRVDEYNAAIREVVAEAQRAHHNAQQQHPQGHQTGSQPADADNSSADKPLSSAASPSVDFVLLDLSARCKAAITAARATKQATATATTATSPVSTPPASTTTTPSPRPPPLTLSPNFFVNSYRIVSCAIRRYALGMSFDRQSQQAGLTVLTPDCIHMNDSGAELLRQLVQEQLVRLQAGSKQSTQPAESTAKSTGM